MMKRKKFIKNGMGLITGTLLFPAASFVRKVDNDPLDKALVHEFVLKAHGDFETVKQMVEKTPALLNAAHDWGNGDFETALGAASHIGHREIATYLIGKGARINIFTAAMLGELAIIKQLIKNYPALLHAKGPHGLDLIHHAKVGGTSAQKVLTFLEQFAPKDPAILPPRVDKVVPKNKYEKQAVVLTDFIHGILDVSREAFIKKHFAPEFIEKKGTTFFEQIFERMLGHIPPANVVLLEAIDATLCKMQLQKTDGSTNFYFKLGFTTDEFPLINRLEAAGRNIFE